MSNVEDTGKAIQDFIAPDLKALAARLEALEKEMKMRFEHVDALFKQVDARFEQADKANRERFSSAEKIAAARHERAMLTFAANHASVINAVDMDKRLAKLESERAKPEAQHV